MVFQKVDMNILRRVPPNQNFSGPLTSVHNYIELLSSSAAMAGEILLWSTLDPAW
jgi:hypothetical protein